MEEKKKEYPRVKINENMPDFSKDPFFVKKHAEAKEFLSKHPIPLELMEKLAKESK